MSTAAQAPAIAQSINATQLSIVVAPTKIVGTSLGGEISASGTGLTGGTLPSLDANGNVAAGTAFTSAANTTFNIDITARAADIAATSRDLGVGLMPATSTYGSQKGYWSDTLGNVGNLAIAANNVATINVRDRQGTTGTAIFSTTMSGLSGSSEIRRVATSSNDQATFDSTRQSARVQIGGSGLSAEANVNMSAATLGNTPTVTVGNATAQDGVAFTKTEAVRTGQAGAVLTASTSNITNPAYGITTITTGGNTAGAITATDMNTLTVNGGGGGTASTLSVIQSMTAF